MRTFKYPTQGDGDEAVVVIVTEAEILRTYFPYWSEQMRRVGKADQISEAACIEDFVTVHWATEVT